jgi:hypothetical protein
VFKVQTSTEVIVSDPQDATNDVGKNTWQIMLIRQAFLHAFRSFDQEDFGPTMLSRILRNDPFIPEFRKNIVSLYRQQHGTK